MENKFKVLDKKQLAKVNGGGLGSIYYAILGEAKDFIKGVSEGSKEVGKWG